LEERSFWKYGPHAGPAGEPAQAAASASSSAGPHDAESSAGCVEDVGLQPAYGAGQVEPVLHAKPLHVLPLPAQSEQSAPYSPQASALSPGLHSPVSVQQPAQLSEPQCGPAKQKPWGAQAWLDAVQLEHAWPFAPQASFSFPTWHAPVASQHPVGHVAAPHDGRKAQ